MKLIVGLGNPGMKYRMTRHNIGYMVLAELAEVFAKHHGLNTPQHKFHGDLIILRDTSLPQHSGESKERRPKYAGPVLLLTPATYMNRSGLSVGEAARFYKIPPSDVLIVCDDLNLPFSRLRLRNEGSSGGQKGLADVLQVLGTQHVPRLRVGIGQPPGQMDAADYVLMNFNEKEHTDLQITVKQSAEAAICWLYFGIEAAMNRYN